MNRYKEVVVFTVMIGLVLSSVAWASISWGNVALTASKTVETSTGTARLAAVVPISETAAKAIAKRAVLGTALTASAEVFGLAALAAGTYYLVTNLDKIKQFFEGQPGVVSFSELTVRNTLHPEWDDARVYNQRVVSNQYSGEAPQQIVVTVTPTSTTFSVDNTGPHHHMEEGPDYKIYAVDTVYYYNGQKGTGQVWGLYPPISYRYVHVGGANHTATASVNLNETALNTKVHENPQVFSDPSYVTPTLTTTAPNEATDYDLGPVQGNTVSTPTADPNTGEATDPATGAQADPSVDPGQETDPLHVPGQAEVPVLDPTIVAPESKSIPDLISGWLSGAPFMSIINNFTVTASSGQSSFDIALPFGSGTGTIDFGLFADLWAAISTIVISFSYIYAVMILFGKG